jgi:hypothetical protein
MNCASNSARYDGFLGFSHASFSQASLHRLQILRDLRAMQPQATGSSGYVSESSSFAGCLDEEAKKRQQLELSQ